MRIRSKSESDFFDHKESLDILQNNFVNFAYKKNCRAKAQIAQSKYAKGRPSQEQNFFKKILNIKENLHETLEMNRKINNGIAGEPKEQLVLVKEKADNEGKFKDFLKLILNFKNDLNSIFLQSKISREKHFLNTFLDLVMTKFIELKREIVFNLKADKTQDDTKKKLVIFPYKSMIETNFDNLILLILTLRRMNSSILYRESKVAIFKSFHNLVNEIKADFSKNLMEIDQCIMDSIKKRFKLQTQAIVFFFTDLNIKLDYYQITLNTLLGKLNSFFTYYIKNSKNQFVKTLIFLENYIKLKESYMQEFNSSASMEFASDDIFMCKFLSFSHFLFSNMYDILDKIKLNSLNNRKSPSSIIEKKFYCLHNSKIYQPYLGLNWRNHKFERSQIKGQRRKKSTEVRRLKTFHGFIYKIGGTSIVPINSTNTHSEYKSSNDNLYANPDKYFEFNKSEPKNSSNDINSHFRTYYNSKLAQWKFLVIDSTKPQTCRICEDVFNFNDYVMHAAFCREHRNNLQLLSNLNSSLSKIIISIKDYRIGLEKNFSKSYLLSPRSGFSSLFKLKQIEKQESIEGQALPKQTDPNIIDFLITILEKEKSKDILFYESNPDRLDSLNKLLLSSLKIYLKNNLFFRENDLESNKLFGSLFSILMKKQIVLEKILTYYETMGFLHNKRTVKVNTKLLSFRIEGSKLNGATSSKCVLDTDRYKGVLTKMTNIFNNHPLSNSGKHKTHLGYFYSSPSRSASENSEQISDNLLGDEVGVADPYCTRKLSRFYYDTSNIKKVSINLKEISKLAKISQNSNVIVEEKEYNETDCNDCYIPKTNIKETGQDNKFQKPITILQIITPNINNLNAPSLIADQVATRGKHNSLSLGGGSIFSEEDEKDKKGNPSSFTKFFDQINIDDCSMQRVDNEYDDGDYDDIFNLLVEVELSQKSFFSPFQTVEEAKTQTDNIISPINKYNKNGNLMVQISDFTMILKLSKGGYGTVELYKKNSTGDYYAIKKVSILKMKTRKSYNLLKNEMQILSQIRNEFVVKIFFLLRDKIHYYFVMEFVPGGDLLGFLNTYIPTTEIIRHFVCEIILGLEYLNKFGIIHRDIKPENIVLDKAGHIKITDFGISQLTNGEELEKSKSDSPNAENKSSDNDEISPIIPKKTKLNLKLNINELNVKPSKNLTVDHNNYRKKSSMESNESQKIVGTDNYIAPEVLNFKPITKSVDLWALGVMIYEMVTGKLPFNAEDSETIRNNIKNFNINWDYLEQSLINREGDSLDTSVVELIKSLIVEEPEDRLGYKNILDLKMHPFLKDWNWLNPSANKQPHIISYVHQQIKSLSNNIKDYKVSRAIMALKNEDPSEPIEDRASSINISIIPALNDKNHDVIKEHVGKGLANMNGLITSDII